MNELWLLLRLMMIRHNTTILLVPMMIFLVAVIILLNLLFLQFSILVCYYLFLSLLIIFKTHSIFQWRIWLFWYFIQLMLFELASSNFAFNLLTTTWNSSLRISMSTCSTSCDRASYKWSINKNIWARISI